jgi:hypothetical protein
MANQYLVDIHQYVSEQMDLARRQRTEAVEQKEACRVRYLDGKLQEFLLLKAFLTDQFNLTTCRYP